MHPTLIRGNAMNMHVYGSSADDSPTVLLIHPMLSSASGIKIAVADHMGAGLRFLAPDLSAHGDEASAPTCQQPTRRRRSTPGSWNTMPRT